MPFAFPPEIQKQLDAFSGDDATQLDQEIAVARLLLQQAIVAGRSGEAVALLRTLSSLSSVQVSNSIRSGKLLAAESVQRIAQRMCAAIAQRLEGVPDYTTIADALGADFQDIFASEKATLRLTDETR